MFKDILIKNQPIIYKILNKAMANNTSHAFLLCGNNISFNKELSIFMAQSLICKNDVLACEKCNECKRIKENIYADLIIFDGNNQSIKKEDIIEIQDRFSKTALEEKGNKIYILNNIDKASISALNSLLKFLEEPTNNTYAILTTSNVDKVLKTISSRCQIINIRNINSNIYMQEAINNNINEIDAYILSNINPFSILEDYESENYQLAKQSAIKFIQNTNDLYGVLYYIQNDIFTKSNSNNIIILDYFIDILYLFLKDKQTKTMDKYNWYQTYISSLKDKDYSQLILLLKNAKDKCRMNNFNVNLILDQLFYQIIAEDIL